MQEKDTYILIDNKPELDQVSDKLSGSPWLAIDTEFERVKTYYPELCLIQIYNGEETFIIDPLEIQNLDSLYELLYSESITKVLHSAHQDLEIFFHEKGSVPAPLFDTQLAAPLLGFAEGIGYGNLIREAMDIELDKGHARTNWKKRPLTQEQLRYAADDVIYLGKVYQLFQDKINEEQRETLVEKTARLLKPETYEPSPNNMWKKIFAARKMKGKSLDALKKLAAWREQTARKQNRPRKWILADHILVDIAKQQPQNKEDLLKIDKLSEKVVKKHGDALINML